MAKSDRFVVESHGISISQECCIIIDKQTGVNYLYFNRAGGSGLTVLVDRDGKPVITSHFEE